MGLHLPVGTHLIIELYGCSNFDFNEDDIRKIVIETESTPLEYIEHIFKPQGKSAVIILEESHITLHTYPEFGYIAVDIFTCGIETKPYNAIKSLKELFKPKYVLINDIQRGVNI